MLPPDGPSACRWSIVTATSSSRRSSAPRACSLGCCAVSTSTTTVVHERGGRSLVSRAEARGDAIACLQEERPSLRRAEERRGRPTTDGIWPVRRCRDGARDGQALRGGPALRELLPAVVQAEGEAARRRQGDQALSFSVNTL